MSSEQVQTIPSPTDRELDAEVAERVMMLPEVEFVGGRLLRCLRWEVEAMDGKEGK
jgi:hypothetical protein